MGKTVLVVGGAGFIGRHVCAALQQSGHTAVAFDRDKDFLEIVKASRRIHGNLFDDKALVAAAAGCDTIIHLAAYANVRWCEQHPGQACNLNIGSCWQLAFQLIRTNASRVIYANSCAAYMPSSVYGWTKRAGLLELREGAAVYGASVASLRLANVYGPGEHDQSRAVPALIAAARDGAMPTLSFAGKVTRDYVHVSDVARAFVLAVEAEGSQVEDRDLEIGTGRRTSLADLWTMIGREFGLERPAFESGPQNDYEPRSDGASPDRASRFLGWKPTIRLEDGLKELCREAALT